MAGAAKLFAKSRRNPAEPRGLIKLQQRETGISFSKVKVGGREENITGSGENRASKCFGASLLAAETKENAQRCLKIKRKWGINARCTCAMSRRGPEMGPSKSLEQLAVS